MGADIRAATQTLPSNCRRSCRGWPVNRPVRRRETWDSAQRSRPAGAAHQTGDTLLAQFNALVWFQYHSTEHSLAATRQSQHVRLAKQQATGKAKRGIGWLSSWCRGCLSVAGSASLPSTERVVVRGVSSRSRLSPRKSAFTAPLDGWSDWCVHFRAPVTTDALIGLGRLSRSPKVNTWSYGAATVPNGRCRMHGGPSTGPRTEAGKAAIRASRTKHGRYSQASITSRREVRSAIRALRELFGPD